MPSDMSRYAILNTIEQLDPEKDNQLLFFSRLATIFPLIRHGVGICPFSYRLGPSMSVRSTGIMRRYSCFIIFFSVGILAYSLESFAQAQSEVKNC